MPVHYKPPFLAFNKCYQVLISSPIYPSRNNSVRDIDKYADEAVAINRMVEQSYGNVSMSLSRSSSFYLDNNELLLMQSITTTTTKTDLAATPTGSPDDYDDYDDETTDGLKRKQSASSLFFRTKLSESLGQQQAHQEQTSGHPMFKIGTGEDYDSDELMLDTRLYTSVENKLNITLTAPIDMQQRLKKVNSNSSDMDADGLSSTLKESNMLIGSSSSSSGSSSSGGSLGAMMSSTGKKKGGSNGRKRRQKKRESEGSLNSSKGSNVVNKSDSSAVAATTPNSMIPINVSIDR